MRHAWVAHCHIPCVRWRAAKHDLHPCPALSEAGNLDKEVRRPMVPRDCRDQVTVVDQAIALLERLERQPNQVEAARLRESIDGLRELGDALRTYDWQEHLKRSAVDIGTLVVSIAKLVVELCRSGNQ